VDERRVEETLVSHVSHREMEKGCVKRKECVKSAFGGAWNKGLGKTGRPQGAKDLQIFWGGFEGVIW